MVVKAFGKEADSVAKFDETNERLYGVGLESAVPLRHNDACNDVHKQPVVCACLRDRRSYGDKRQDDDRQRTGIHTVFEVFYPSYRTDGTDSQRYAVHSRCGRACVPSSRRRGDKPDSTRNSIDKTKGAVVFDHVKFGYEPGITIIKDMNLNVSPGDVVAIVGPTGAGKTTLVNLLMRFYEVDSGRILVDDIDITSVPRENLRKEFGMVLQDTWLFGGTIEDNIRYGNDKANKEDIIKAAKMAHADHFIRTLPDGYDTVLNEEASNISQGQKQLLTIARALLADPAVLILDEATSSVDTRTEEYIQSAMIELMKGRTNFVIAHRLSTIRDASTILVMNEGEVIEQGNHASLMSLNGFYADLYNSQFLGEEI